MMVTYRIGEQTVRVSAEDAKALELDARLFGLHLIAIDAATATARRIDPSLGQLAAADNKKGARPKPGAETAT